jgi:hypothetical protein
MMGDGWWKWEEPLWCQTLSTLNWIQPKMDGVGRCCWDIIWLAPEAHFQQRQGGRVSFPNSSSASLSNAAAEASLTRRTEKSDRPISEGLQDATWNRKQKTEINEICTFRIKEKPRADNCYVTAGTTNQARKAGPARYSSTSVCASPREM